MASAAEIRQENGSSLSASSVVEGHTDLPSASVAAAVEGASFPAKLAESAGLVGTASAHNYPNASACENPCGATDCAAEPCPSPSGTEVDSIPQWKRDLIHRRKTNIARTIGANQPAACPIKDCPTELSPDIHFLVAGSHSSKAPIQYA